MKKKSLLSLFLFCISFILIGCKADPRLNGEWEVKSYDNGKEVKNKEISSITWIIQDGEIKEVTEYSDINRSDRERIGEYITNGLSYHPKIKIVWKYDGGRELSYYYTDIYEYKFDTPLFGNVVYLTPGSEYRELHNEGFEFDPEFSEYVIVLTKKRDI